MSTQTHDIQENTKRAERPVLHREFAAELSSGNGRTVDVRIVPYGEQITHDDGYGGVPKGVPYQEEWVPGAFTAQANVPQRHNEVLVNFEHQEGLAGVVGHGLTLREDADGFYGSFWMHETSDGDKALMLVREKVLKTVSLEAKPLKTVRTASGVVQRVKAHLYNIALTRFGAYAGAVVLAVREEAEIVFDEALLPVEIDPELVARVERLGIALPERLKAHPAPDTPSEEDTPESDTRHDGEANSEVEE